MKRLFINSLIALTLCTGVNAQTRPQQSMYFFNPSLLNPAATGIEDYGQLRVGMRRQWVGVDGAPSTAWLNGEMRIGAKADNQSDSMMVNKGQGIGLNIYYDKIGPYSTANVNVSYAYHLPLSESFVLSAGFAGGLRHTRYDMSKSVYPDQGADPAAIAQTSISKKYTPDMNAGLQLSGKRFFAGVSVMQLFPANYIDEPGSDAKLKREFLASAGYTIPFTGEATSFSVSGVFKSDFSNPARFDINARIRHEGLGWLGTTFRKDDCWGIGLGLDLGRSLSFGYLYEIGINKHISNYTKGSHEACIAFKFLKSNQSGRPKMSW